MAGDWIKLEKATLDKPEVFAIAAQLGIDVDAALGKLFRVWNWFDDHTSDGNARSVTHLLADRLTAVPGFGAAMISQGWLHEKDGVLSLPNFDRHNGKTAKKRAVTKNRVETHRGVKRTGNADSNADSNARSVTPSVTREEKRRVQNKSIGAFAPPDWVPEAPWKHYIEMRTRIKKPMTGRAMELAIVDLERLVKQGYDATTVLDTAVKNSWQGLWAPRDTVIRRDDPTAGAI